MVEMVNLEAAFDEELADELVVVTFKDDLTLDLVHLGVNVDLLVLSLQQAGVNELTKIFVEFLF